MIIICTYQYNIKIFRNFLHIFYWMKKFCINGRKKINKTNSVTAVGRIVKGGFFVPFSPILSKNAYSNVNII